MIQIFATKRKGVDLFLISALDNIVIAFKRDGFQLSVNVLQQSSFTRQVSNIRISIENQFTKALTVY